MEEEEEEVEPRMPPPPRMRPADPRSYNIFCVSCRSHKDIFGLVSSSSSSVACWIRCFLFLFFFLSSTIAVWLLCFLLFSFVLFCFVWLGYDFARFSAFVCAKINEYGNNRGVRESPKTSTLLWIYKSIMLT